MLSTQDPNQVRQRARAAVEARQTPRETTAPRKQPGISWPYKPRELSIREIRDLEIATVRLRDPFPVRK